MVDTLSPALRARRTPFDPHMTPRDWPVSTIVLLSALSLDNRHACHTRDTGTLPSVFGVVVVLSSLCYVSPSTLDQTTRFVINSRSFPLSIKTIPASMSKDSRHDGRRRSAGQHRLGPRISQGGDGRDRSGSNSSGSSHGGGKSKNTPIVALKVSLIVSTHVCFEATHSIPNTMNEPSFQGNCVLPG